MRHGSARDSVVNGAKKIAIGLAVAFLWTSQIRTTAAAARAKPVAESAVGAELRFTVCCALADSLVALNKGPNMAAAAALRNIDRRVSQVFCRLFIVYPF